MGFRSVAPDLENMGRTVTSPCWNVYWYTISRSSVGRRSNREWCWFFSVLSHHVSQMFSGDGIIYLHLFEIFPCLNNFGSVRLSLKGKILKLSFCCILEIRLFCILKRVFVRTADLRSEKG